LYFKQGHLNMFKKCIFALDFTDRFIFVKSKF
jgi:hypothetical protein